MAAVAAATTTTTTAAQILESLSSADDSSRARGLADLDRFINAHYDPKNPPDGGRSGGGGGASHHWLQALETKIRECMMTKPMDVARQRAGLLALTCLLKRDVVLLDYLHHFHAIAKIRPSADLQLMEFTAQTLGKLHQSAGGSKFHLRAEYEIKVHFEFLEHYEQEHELLLAVLMLKELALAVPSLFIAMAEEMVFYHRIIPALQVARLTIREKAAALLNVAIRLNAQRESKESSTKQHDFRMDWCHQLYRSSKSLSEHVNNENHCHGALLILNELLHVSSERSEKVEASLSNYYVGSFQYLRRNTLNSLPADKLDSLMDSSHSRDTLRPAQSQSCRLVIEKNYLEICSQVLYILLNCKTPFVKNSLVLLLPRLAAVDPIAFKNHRIDPKKEVSNSNKELFGETITYLVDNSRQAVVESRKAGAAAAGAGGADVLEIKALALLCKTLGEFMMPHKARIFHHIEFLFSDAVGKKSTRLPTSALPHPPPPSAYALVAAFVQAVQYQLSEAQFSSLYHNETPRAAAAGDARGEARTGGLLIRHGLNRQVAICYHELCLGAPPTLKLELRNSLFNVIAHKLYEFEVHKASEASLKPGATAAAASRRASAFLQHTADAADQLEASVTMALEILGCFDFTGVALSRVVDFCATKLLAHEKVIRLPAAKACCNLLISDDATFLLNTNRALTAKKESELTLKETLPKMINIGVTDRDQDIRFAILSSLDARFDQYLAQADNLNSLFIALHDEYFPVREYIVCMLGRLSERNAAYVMPTLRNFLVQLLTELQYCTHPDNQEQCAILIGNLVYNTPRLVRPYLDSIMQCMIPKLAHTEAQVAIAIMRTIGMQAEVSGQEIGKFLKQLMPIVIEFIKDSQNERKRIVGLWALGHMVFSSGCVIQPYREYPELLEILLESVKSETRVQVRRETIKVLGAIGPLDPYTYKTLLQPSLLQSVRAAEKETESADGPLTDMTSMLESSAMDEIYPAIATDALLKILADPSQARLWGNVVQTFKFMIMSMGIKSTSFVPRIMPAYLHVLKSQKEGREAMLSNISRIVITVNKHVRPFVNDIVHTLDQIWDRGSEPRRGGCSYEIKIIELMSHLAYHVGSDLKLCFHLLVPHVMGVLTRDESERNASTYHLVTSFANYGSVLDGFIHIILPAVVAALHNDRNGTKNKKAVLNALLYFLEKLDVGDFSSLIIHAVLRLLESLQQKAQLAQLQNSSSSSSSSHTPQPPVDQSTVELTNKSVDVIAAVAFVLQTQFSIFQPVVDHVLKKYAIQHATYDFVLKNIGSLFCTHTGKYRTEISDKVFKKSAVPADLLPHVPPPTGPTNELTAVQKDRMDVEELKKAWTIKKKAVSKDDWLNWFRTFNYTLLVQSPSPVLRGCAQLDYAPLHRDLFNVAFLSCWIELDQIHQNELCEELCRVLAVENVPELTLQILNLAEFMEHSEKGPLPIDHLLLGERALKSGAYAKALYYRESALQHEQHNSAGGGGGGEVRQILESLIRINTKLQNYEAATGVLKLATSRKDFVVDESWYESLGQWENALQQYQLRIDQQVAASKPVPNLVIGKMRCLSGLAEWQELYNVAESIWGSTDYLRGERPQVVAELAVNACWALGNWDDVPKYTNHLTNSPLTNTYYSAAIAIHNKDGARALRLIQECRDLVDDDLTTLVLESYSRAYSTLVFVKHLTEMEETIAFNLLHDSRQAHIKQMWRNRLLGGQPNLDDWQKSLIVHSLALTPEENEVTLLKYASLCMRHNKMKLSRKVLQSLLPDVQLPSSVAELSAEGTERLAGVCHNKMPVVYMFMKQMWEQSHMAASDADRRVLIKSLGFITKKISHLYAMNGGGGGSGNPQLTPAAAIQAPLASSAPPGCKERNREQLKQVARFCLLNASWQRTVEGVTPGSIHDILAYCSLATEHDKMYYKAWRLLAQCSTDALQLLRSQSSFTAAAATGSQSATANNGGGGSSGSSNGMSPGSVMSHRSSVGLSRHVNTEFRNHFLTAVNGFVKSIKHCWDKKRDTLQDTLRLLTLLFENANTVDSGEPVIESLKLIHIDVWLQVIPQLIARVASPRTVIGKIILQLLIDIAKAHPHAAIYPLLVGSKSSSSSRCQAVGTVLEAMKDKYPELIKQAQIFSHELIRVSILWHELWHEGLEEASRLYFADRNPRGMFAILEPLHELIEKGPETMKETSFNQHFGRDLMEAQACCQKFQRHGHVRELNQAWELYYQVFRRIAKQIQPMTTLELNYVSPKLLNYCRDLELAVPGTYEPNQPIIRIASVSPSIYVLSSKQRPRKLCISGSNGKEYQFLLKGHEDLRQDERVLQLFGLVNSLLSSDKMNLRRNLGTIPQYAVIPLSTNSGLIGWVPHCDTLHTLIKEYREKTKTLLNFEHKLMLRLSNDYDHLTKMQKVEVFESALNSTEGLDLAKIMWYRSQNSEVWYERRLTYTRSLAVMSMVGYILGLGDRHPSNIMLERTTGNIIHIDFGDCFEVAVHREKFPEKIPFRLTRMLIRAMEVNGVEGNYRITCEIMMRLLRQNKDSLTAVLEAFVNDPLLNWLILEHRGANNGAQLSNRNDTSATGDQTNGANGGAMSHDSLRHSSGNASLAVNTNNGGGGDEPANVNAAAASNNHSGSTCNKPPEQAAGQAGHNRRALEVLQRVHDKLNGEDFGKPPGQAQKLDVEKQVKKLIDQATSHENLCQCYIGWCPFW